MVSTIVSTHLENQDVIETSNDPFVFHAVQVFLDMNFDINLPYSQELSREGNLGLAVKVFIIFHSEMWQ